MAPQYTAEEKKWLKDNWGDEFHFLRAYALSIYKEEDRDEGRRIVRGFMEDDASSLNNFESVEETQKGKLLSPAKCFFTVNMSKVVLPSTS